MDNTNDVGLLLAVAPPHIREALESKDRLDLLMEVVMDLGRRPEARFPDGIEELSPVNLSEEDIHYVVARVGKFADDNRAGIERTLHRISAIRNRVGSVIGLTCRVGRAVFGAIDILRDIIESGASILLMGRPGVGKTTLLREAARVLADDLGKRVIVVDTSNEIGGDGDIPHPGIGRARRMQVPSPDRQHAVMIEAVENHMPEVIVIDEIGTEADALAARTIAERGVQLIATAHGVTLENILQNPTLSDLLGGVHAVTLSDEEARRRRTQKTVLERKAPPTFGILIEIQEKDTLAVHRDTARVVDSFLRSAPLRPEIRTRTGDGRVEIKEAAPEDEPMKEFPDEAKRSNVERPAASAYPSAPVLPLKRPKSKSLRIFTYGVSRSRLERAIQKLHAPARIVTDLEHANMILTLKSQEKRQPKRLLAAREQGAPLHILKSNTMPQIENFLIGVLDLPTAVDAPLGEDAAMKEAEAAIDAALDSGLPIELSPQNSYVRRLQHQLAERYQLTSRSKGREPFRHVVIFPD